MNPSQNIWDFSFDFEQNQICKANTRSGKSRIFLNTSTHRPHHCIFIMSILSVNHTCILMEITWLTLEWLQRVLSCCFSPPLFVQTVMFQLCHVFMLNSAWMMNKWMNSCEFMDYLCSWVSKWMNGRDEPWPPHLLSPLLLSPRSSSPPPSTLHPFLSWSQTWKLNRVNHRSLSRSFSVCLSLSPVPLSLCPAIYLSLCLPVFVCSCLSLCLSISVFVSSVSLSLYLYPSVSASLSLSNSVLVSVCISVSLPRLPPLLPSVLLLIRVIPSLSSYSCAVKKWCLPVLWAVSVFCI